MKIEFYALFLFLISIIFLSILVSQKEEIIMEEVLPSPFLSVKNPYKRLINKSVNEINRQLFFLEYGKSISFDIRDLKEIEEIIFQVQDPRAKKEVIRKFWKYWWGLGIEEVTFRIKHINIRWYPIIYMSNYSQITFGEALYNALNGTITPFSKMSSNENMIKLISEKYKVEFIEK